MTNFRIQYTVYKNTFILYEAPTFHDDTKTISDIISQYLHSASTYMLIRNEEYEYTIKLVHQFSEIISPSLYFPVSVRGPENEFSHLKLCIIIRCKLIKWRGNKTISYIRILYYNIALHAYHYSLQPVLSIISYRPSV